MTNPSELTACPASPPQSEEAVSIAPGNYGGTESVASSPNFTKLFSALERIGPGELQVRFENSQRLLMEQGVSCFVDQNGKGVDRLWQLDLLPLVIGEEEWRGLESALIQRAGLLNLILEDL